MFSGIADVVLVACDRWMTLLRWTGSAAALLDVEAAGYLLDNVLARMFGLANIRGMYGERWEAEVRLLLGQELIAVLRNFPDFQRLWSMHEVHAVSETLPEPVALDHARFEGYRVRFDLPASGGGHVMMITPSDGIGRGS